MIELENLLEDNETIVHIIFIMNIGHEITLYKKAVMIFQVLWK